VVLTLGLPACGAGLTFEHHEQRGHGGVPPVVAFVVPPSVHVHRDALYADVWFPYGRMEERAALSMRFAGEGASGRSAPLDDCTEWFGVYVCRGIRFPNAGGEPSYVRRGEGLPLGGDKLVAGPYTLEVLYGTRVVATHKFELLYLPTAGRRLAWATDPGPRAPSLVLSAERGVLYVPIDARYEARHLLVSWFRDGKRAHDQRLALEGPRAFEPFIEVRPVALELPREYAPGRWTVVAMLERTVALGAWEWRADDESARGGGASYASAGPGFALPFLIPSTVVPPPAMQVEMSSIDWFYAPTRVMDERRVCAIAFAPERVPAVDHALRTGRGAEKTARVAGFGAGCLAEVLPARSRHVVSYQHPHQHGPTEWAPERD
jgi:hypothetical protein